MPIEALANANENATFKMNLICDILQEALLCPTECCRVLSAVGERLD